MHKSGLQRLQTHTVCSMREHVDLATTMFCGNHLKPLASPALELSTPSKRREPLFRSSRRVISNGKHFRSVWDPCASISANLYVFAQILPPCSERFFAKRRRKPLVTVVLNLTSMQLTAVKYVTWVITLLTNHRGVITIPPIRNEGQILFKSYWCGTISQLTTVDSEDDYRSGSGNVSHQQQSF